jgi:AcrR family transcriptional regulator
VPAQPKRTRRNTKLPKLALAPKMVPAQSRAAETYEHLLEVTAQVLAEVGFELLTTNLVCERAKLRRCIGISPTSTPCCTNWACA